MARCTECGAAIKTGRKSCEYCGARVDTIGEATIAATPKKGAVESVLGFVEDRRKRIEDEKRQKEEAAEAAQRAEEAEVQKAAYFIGKHWKVTLAVVVALVMIISIGLWSQPKDQAEGNTAAMPEAASELKGDNYQDVKTKLQAAGFTSIETSAMPDLVVGWLKKDGEVEAVSVNGETDFDTDVRFPKSTTIVIRYHTFPERESATAATSQPPPAPAAPAQESPPAPAAPTQESPPAPVVTPTPPEEQPAAIEPDPVPAAEPSAKATKEVTVYVTETGSKYHTANCGSLKKSKIAVTLAEAKASGCTPCSRCSPPR